MEKNNYNNALDEVSKENSKDVLKSDLINGWHLLNLSLLSYNGKYYPKGTEIKVKPFSTKEVIHFTSINENNPLEVDRAFQYILKSCVKCYVNGNPIPTDKFLFNLDRFAVILLIRVYSDMRTDLSFEHKCSNKKCKTEQKVKVIPQNLVFSEDLISKYFDETSGMFEIKMMSSEGMEKTYIYSPVTLKENSELFDFMINERENIDETELKVLVKLFPFMRQFIGGCKDLGEVYDRFKGLSKYEIADLALLEEKVSLEAKQSVSTVCNKCGHVEDVQMRFPDGFKAIVVSKAENDGFLL